MPTSIPSPNTLTVDFNKTLESMIASGRYDWTNSDITSTLFPISSKGIVRYERKLLSFNRNIYSEEAIKLIEAEDETDPWQPGKIEHLLSSGRQNPEEQREFPIVALGSVAKVKGFRRASFLDGRDSERSLDLDCFDTVWDSLFRFLMVRELVS